MYKWYNLNYLSHIKTTFWLDSTSKFVSVHWENMCSQYVYNMYLITYVQVAFIFIIFLLAILVTIILHLPHKTKHIFMTLFGFLDAEIDKQKVCLHCIVICYLALHDKTFFFLLNVTRNEIFKNINSWVVKNVDHNDDKASLFF